MGGWKIGFVFVVEDKEGVGSQHENFPGKWSAHTPRMTKKRGQALGRTHFLQILVSQHSGRPKFLSRSMMSATVALDLVGHWVGNCVACLKFDSYIIAKTF